MKSDKAVVSLTQYLSFIDITQVTKRLPCADVGGEEDVAPPTRRLRRPSARCLDHARAGLGGRRPPLCQRCCLAGAEAWHDECFRGLGHHRVMR